MSWQIINVGSGYDLTIGSALFYVNTNHGFISDNIHIGSTTNAGATWVTVYSGKEIYHDIHFLSDNVGYITDRNRILKTTDGGITWNREVGLVNGDFIEIHFKDLNHGWACGLGGTMLKYEK
jgi:photosystem II stability/assembly factor-like uncharacterized protein